MDGRLRGRDGFASAPPIKRIAAELSSNLTPKEDTMKKPMRKLVLARETVRDLTTQDLREIAGGDDTERCSGFWERIKQSTSYVCAN